MRYPRALIIVLALLVSAFFPPGVSTANAAPKAPRNKVVILATTTSTQDSGLLDVLLPEFEKETRYFVKTISVGSGQALAMGRNAGRKPLRFVPVVTRENRPGVLHQRLPKLITSGGLEETAGLQLSAEDSRILVCGNPQMLDDVRDALVERGLRMDRSKTPGNFATENYW